jgi:hypothetical protein
MKLYSIRDWAKNFELRDTTRVDGPLKWIPIPTKTDGLGFGRVRQHKRSTDILAAWYLMLGVAAKQAREHRGTLARDGIPLTAEDLGLMTGFDASIFVLALDVLSQANIGWIDATNTGDDAATYRTDAASCGENGLQERRGEEKRGDKRTVGQTGSAVASPASDSEWLQALANNEAYQGIAVRTEFAKMQAWCSTNRKQPTRRRFINWLNRAEKPIRPTANYAPAPVTDPANWRKTLKVIRPDSEYSGSYAALPQSIRDEISHYKQSPSSQ